MDNNKWVWGDEEDSSPKGAPLLDAALTPVTEWPGLEPEPPSPADTPKQCNEKPEEVPPAVTETRDEPAPAPVPPRTRKTSPSLMRAIVLHLEGRIEEAIQEIKIGLQQGEPPAELYSAVGALQVELRW